jgi:hypothetical protein
MILMKAIVYTKYGSPDVLQIGEIEKPEPEDDEVLIRIHAAEVTKADCELRSFNFAVKWFWLPLRVAIGVTKPKKTSQKVVKLTTWFLTWLPEAPIPIALTHSIPKGDI